jgi:hypothetical protein
MRPLQAHCHCGLSSLYAKISRWDAARDALSAAIALYRAMEMTFWLSQAQAAVAEVEGRRGPVRIGTKGLWRAAYRLVCCSCLWPTVEIEWASSSQAPILRKSILG